MMQKVVVFTLGCKVNDVESASIVKGLKERGYEVDVKLGYADLYILNTCAVTGEAEKKSRQLVARVKKYNPDAKIIVCGCAAEKNFEAFASREGVTLVTGARQKSKIFELLTETGVRIDDTDKVFDELPLPAQTKSRHFIKIQDGCNNFCSYCIVPYLRGRSRSRNLQSIVAEAGAITTEEIVLTGIDISSYNDEGKRLPQLLFALKDLPVRIRLGSLEVNVIDEELLQIASALPDFAPHFHLSLQSGSNNVLKGMNRKYTREEYIQKCNLIYEYFPHAAITTDIIVGFPSETESDFLESLRIVDEVRFAQIHPFVYSPREGTRAAKMAQLPPAVKDERKERMLQAATITSQRYVARFLGEVLEFIPEEVTGGKTFGYTQNYIRVAVDGRVEKKSKIKLIKDKQEYCIGEIYDGN